MAASLRGPVGRRGRVQNVANFASDQAQVISLLASLPAAKGGKSEAWANPPLAGPDGACPLFVSDAIWDFQSFWKARGVFRNIDGVVDPGGHTLAQMNNLAAGGSGVSFAAAGAAAAAAGGAGGAGAAFGQPAAAPAQGTSIDAFTRGMQSIFGHPTDWSFQGSAGGGGGFLGVAVGGGTIDLSSPTASAPASGTLGYVFAGASAGVDGGPDATFSYSTGSMWSAGVGNIRARTSEPLTFDDFKGPMCIASITAISSFSLGHGGSITFYMLGLPTIVGVAGLFEGPLVLAFLSQAAATATALGTMVGQSNGVDTGFTIAPGYAR